jgi:tRNA(Ile2) C34 agmatinyltransferase TiaS
MTTDWGFIEEEPDPDIFVSYCPTCGHMTPMDGWSMSSGKNAVEWFCYDCGATKGSVAFEDIPRDLQSLIQFQYHRYNREWRIYD